ncbi:MAG: hypothetical protein MJZ41_10920 [Bacteroidaceae bacterium]|nr:hypothetical protein [Bacteroidaceae bacterium]
MHDISSLFDWQILLLISPFIISIAIFCGLLWSDSQHSKKRQKETADKKRKKLNNV